MNKTKKIDSNRENVRKFRFKGVKIKLKCKKQFKITDFRVYKLCAIKKIAGTHFPMLISICDFFFSQQKGEFKQTQTERARDLFNLQNIFFELILMRIFDTWEFFLFDIFLKVW